MDNMLLKILLIFMTLAFAIMCVKYDILAKEYEELKHENIRLESVVEYLENANNNL